jgi:hypothetical protein
MDTHEELLKLLEKQRAIENEIGVSLLSRPICQTVSALWLLAGHAREGLTMSQAAVSALCTSSKDSTVAVSTALLTALAPQV